MSSDALGDLSRDGENFRRSVQLSFHAQTIAVAVAALAADALVAARVADLETILARRAGSGPAIRRGITRRPGGCRRLPARPMSRCATPASARFGS